MCEYCEQNRLNKELVYNGINYQWGERIVIVQDENGIFKLKYQEITDDMDWSDGDVLEIQIFHCPICGRKLENKNEQ